MGFCPLKKHFSTSSLDIIVFANFVEKKTNSRTPCIRAKFFAAELEARRCAEAELKRRLRKERAADVTIINLCTCQICGRSRRAKLV